VDATPLHLAFLAVAGVAAGILGTAGGITSLIAYPALLAVGVPAFPANLTNSIALHAVCQHVNLLLLTLAQLFAGEDAAFRERVFS